ncbi:kinesin-like protein KIF20A isoform 7-T8 [Liasis olivaceus]
MNFQESYGIAFMQCSTVEAISREELSKVSSPEEQQEVKELYQPLKVYLRVRPFSKAELENNENQDCLIIENQETVTLQAPKELAPIKNNEKKIGQSAHQFTFTKVFGPDTTQNEFFEGTMKDIVKAYLNGRNGLVFTYGVTNAGKSFTVQDGGILPRSLDMIFNHIKGRQYSKMNLKPCFSNFTKRLNDMQVKQEESMKAALLVSLKEETENIWKPLGPLSASDAMSRSCNSPNLPLDQLDYKPESVNSEASTKRQKTLASLWVSFFEIYNEYIYDLLDLLPALKNQKRKVLRICEDQGGNFYIKDLKWVNVTNSEEACKILKIGNKNRSLACTKMNQQSSRSHSIFSIRLLRLSDEDVPCILGISELRPTYIPFRESKLTRLFQPFFCGKGKACMIVNVSQCASTYDETLHVMKFSAVAKQIIQTFQHKLFDYFPQKYTRREDKPTVHFDEISIEQFPMYADVATSSEDEEIDITILSHEDLLKTTEMLKDRLIAERQGKLLLEVQIRKEMAKAMFQQLMETEEAWSKRLEDLKESYEEKLENKFEMYKDAIKKHAYACAMDQIEERYVPVEEFIAEQEKVQDREMKILELKQKLGEQNSLPSENPCSVSTEWKRNQDTKCKLVEETSDALQKPCEERDEEQEIIGLQNWAKCDHESEATLSHIREESNESKDLLSAESIKHHKSKNGFFASLKYTVTDGPKTSKSKGLEKPEESPTASHRLVSVVHQIKQ